MRVTESEALKLFAEADLLELGKAGGVKLAHNLQEVRQYAEELLGKTLVTHQTGAEGKVVKRLLIEAGSNIKKEYYLSFVSDRKTARVVMMGSEEGGVEIEKVAAESPEKIFKEYISTRRLDLRPSRRRAWLTK